MKKIIFGSASALLAVIGFSAFKTAKTSTTTYYWFQISAEGIAPGTLAVLNNAGAAFVERSTTLATGDSPCNQIKLSQCVVGFTAAQIFTTTNGGKVLKTHGVDPSVSTPSQTAKTSRTSAAYVRND